jgi:magnesium-transporting ATPase (P-type)
MRAFAFLGPVEAALSMAMLPIGAAILFGWRFGAPLPSSGSDLDVLSAMVFAAIVVMQMANAFECRSDPGSLSSIGPLSNRLLVVAIGFEAVVLIGFLYLRPLAEALGNGRLGLSAWLPILITPLLFLGTEEGRKAWVRAVRHR